MYEDLCTVVSIAAAVEQIGLQIRLTRQIRLDRLGSTTVAPSTDVKAKDGANNRVVAAGEI